MKSLIKRAVRLTPYRITRSGAGNRFQAIDDCLGNLARRGYRPLHVIDGGANTGDFARLARRTWPHSTVHMIEPQLSCRPALEALARQPGFVVHSCAIGDAEGVLTLAADPAATSTGAHVLLNQGAEAKDQSASKIQTPVKTLDSLLRTVCPHTVRRSSSSISKATSCTLFAEHTTC